MTDPLKPAAVLCRDGTRFAVESLDGTLLVTTPSPDPVRETSGLARSEAALQCRAGVLRHNGVPIDTVRAYIRQHGGYADAGPEALETLKAAGQGGEEAAPERPFPGSRPTPRLPPGSRPGVTVCKLPDACS